MTESLSAQVITCNIAKEKVKFKYRKIKRGELFPWTSAKHADFSHLLSINYYCIDENLLFQGIIIVC